MTETWGNLSFATSVNFNIISMLFYVKLFDGGAVSPSLTKGQMRSSLSESVSSSGNGEA